MVEINSEEQNKIKRMKRTEGSLRDLRVSEIKCTNIWIIGAPEEKNEYEKTFEKITVQNLSNMEKEIIKSKRHKSPI